MNNLRQTTVILLLTVITGWGCASLPFPHRGDRPRMQPSDFSVFLQEFEASSPEKQERLAWSFIQQVKWRGGTPLFDSTNVVFLAWNSQPLSLSGMPTQWHTVSMQRLGSTPLQFYRQQVPEDSRFEYVLVDEFMTSYRDPLNNNAWVKEGRGRSVVMMPGWREEPYVRERPEGVHGTVDTLAILSNSLGYTRYVFVYLPPKYDPLRTRPYPLFVVGDGYSAMIGGRITTVLDNLSADGKIDPPIALLLATDEEHRWREYGGRREWRTFVVDDLLPEISSRYNITAQRDQTAIFGISRSGLMAADLALHQPERFGLLAACSPALDLERSAIIEAYRRSTQLPLRSYVCLGYFETAAAPDVEQWVTLMKEKGGDVRYHRGHDGHSWFYWRTELVPILTWFFPPVDTTGITYPEDG